ncbi:MAG: GNAT superfamily N-acetyltransferase [Lentisphaeria bacterium]
MRLRSCCCIAVDEDLSLGWHVSDSIKKVTITNLKEQPPWIDTVALWHHQEWLNGRKLLNECQTSRQHIDAKLDERKASLKRHMDNAPLPITFIAHLDDLPLGSVSLVYYQFVASAEQSEWLTNLYVVPTHRCKGIASTLLDHAQRYAHDIGLERLLLYTTDQANFYKKRGWITVNEGLVQGHRVEILDYIINPLKN